MDQSPVTPQTTGQMIEKNGAEAVVQAHDLLEALIGLVGERAVLMTTIASLQVAPNIQHVLSAWIDSNCLSL